MAEYIIDEEDLASVEPPIYPEKDYEFPERIVRCKDCGFLAIDRWFGTDYFCSILRMTVEPNGFCAWGEPREYTEPTIADKTEEDTQP